MRLQSLVVLISVVTLGPVGAAVGAGSVTQSALGAGSRAAEPLTGSACLDLVDWSSAKPSDDRVRILDKWGRDITLSGILLTDWEGPMGNPEILLTLVAPARGSFPLTVTLLAAERSLLYLHDSWVFGRMVLPSASGYRGGYSITFENPGEQRRVRLGNHPDPDSRSERQWLRIRQSGGAPTQRVPVHVCDQDRERDPDFEIGIESEADDTGFFARHPEAHTDLQQIADDVAYYLDSMDEDPVAAGAASTQLADGRMVTNVDDFRGMVLKAAGWVHGNAPEDVWSTGFPGSTRLTRDGASTDVYAIGTLGPHPDGDRSAVNTSGWKFSDRTRKWYRQGYTQTGRSPTGDCPDGEQTCHWYHVSFYSVQKHEMLHALAYETRYPVWNTFAAMGCIDDEAVTAYTGRCTPLVDPVHAWDPVLHRRQWNEGPELIDKFELLVLQAVGWRLRDTTPFRQLAVIEDTVSSRPTRRDDGARIEVEGGVAPFDFTIESGSLPAGLSLNRFTGEIEGTTDSTGSYVITVRIRDNGVDEVLFSPLERRDVPANGISEEVTIEMR